MDEEIFGVDLRINVFFGGNAAVDDGSTVSLTGRVFDFSTIGVIELTMMTVLGCFDEVATGTVAVLVGVCVTSQLFMGVDECRFFEFFRL